MHACACMCLRVLVCACDCMSVLVCACMCMYLLVCACLCLYVQCACLLHVAACLCLSILGAGVKFRGCGSGTPSIRTEHDARSLDIGFAPRSQSGAFGHTILDDVAKF